MFSLTEIFKVTVVILVMSAVALANLYDSLVNVALGKPAAIKDVNSGKNGGAAHFAVDGISEPHHWRHSCANTESTTNTWLMVDLLGDFEIVAVKLTNRAVSGERLKNFTVHVSLNCPNDTNEFPKEIPGQMCFYREKQIPEGKSEVVPCTKPIKGRYIIVFKSANNLLTICELEALAMKPVTLSYNLLKGERISKIPLFTVNNITSEANCLYSCFSSPDAHATAAQFMKRSGICECVEIDGFATSKPAAEHNEEWNLYLAINN